MNQVTHTPGPWYFQSGCIVPDGDTYEDDGVTTYRGDGWQRGIAQLVKNPADGRLIAAAPVLLAAAQNTLAYYAATQPGRTCLIDELNPCGGIKHWGIGDGCPLCSARSAIVEAGI